MYKYSFIIPTYNSEKYVLLCVQSILDMHREDIEIVIIDDGSKDNTRNICKCICENNANVRLICKDNGGVSSTRNLGILSAEGEYVIFVDSDDMVESEKMNFLLDKISIDSNIDMAIYGMSFNYYYKNNCYRKDEILPPMDKRISNSNLCECIYDLFSHNCISPCWNKVIKKELLTCNNIGFREDMFFYEDFEFSINCMKVSENILLVQDCIYQYRQVEDEGNAGRRLLKISDLSKLSEQIEIPLMRLVEGCGKKEVLLQAKDIILDLYLTWAKEKIAVCDSNEIRIIQRDFRKWWDKHKYEVSKSRNEKIVKLLNGTPISFKMHNIYIYFRHGLAIRLKNLGIVQRKNGR
ncbi:MAG: glycosyltransferase family 2 protein [Lachnospiraceae bacterium]|nr:glycosyltransferase family 2 protein [Lachnospiraceae bacterium]